MGVVWGLLSHGTTTYYCCLTICLCDGGRGGDDTGVWVLLGRMDVVLRTPTTITDPDITTLPVVCVMGVGVGT